MLMRAALTTALTGLVLAIPLRATAQERPTIRSVRLQEVARAARAVDTLDTTEFWREIARGGAPLVESVPGGGDSVLVTLVWKGGVDTRNVVVFSGLTGWLTPGNMLERVPGTDIWYGSYAARPDVRFTYRISVNDNLRHYLHDPDWAARRDAFRLDPFNPRSAPLGGGMTASLFDGPAVERIPADEAGVLSYGRLEAATVGERRVDLYVPTRTQRSALGLAVVFDGGPYTEIVRAPDIVDRLIGAGRLPPSVVALVRHPDRWEDLAPNDRFVAFVADTLLPYLDERFPIAPDPAMRVVAGSSLGGLAAAYIGHRLPDRFGNVIAQSGAYWWAPEDHAEPRWLIDLFRRTARRPIRFYLDAGALESGPVRGGPGMLDLSRWFRDVLCAKGYEVRFRTFEGGHAYVNWRRTLPDALVFALGAHPAEPTCPASAADGPAAPFRPTERAGG